MRSNVRLAAKKKSVCWKLLEIERYLVGKEMKKNLQNLQSRVSGSSRTGPVVDMADNLLTLLQQNTVKTFRFLFSEVFVERLEDGTLSNV